MVKVIVNGVEVSITLPPPATEGLARPYRYELESALSFLEQGDAATARGILAALRAATPVAPEVVVEVARELIAATITNAPYAQRVRLANRLEGLLEG